MQSLDDGTRQIEAQAQSVELHVERDFMYKRILRPLAAQRHTPFYGGVVSKGKFARGPVGVTNITNEALCDAASSASNTQGKQQQVIRSEIGASRMRGRLLVSATRSEEVAALIDRARTWNGSYSTIVMMCCRHCGAFFIEHDISWPSACPFGSEHEEFVTLAL
jgi:hypothetical protein